jgi:hypothetical protein
MAKDPKRRTSEIAITRPLRHFEVDKYWAKVAALAIHDSWLAVFDQFSWGRLIVPAAVTAIASGIQFHYMGWASTEDNLKILGTSVAAGACVFGVLVVIHLVRKPCELHISSTEAIGRLSLENDQLRQRAIGTGLSMAEEDPRVWLKPLNSEYLSHGFMPFELSNRGQRVNPAQGITIQPIPCVPSVRFDYVDCLVMDEQKRVLPIVGGDIVERYDILPELEKAWKASWETGTADPEAVDLEFQIKITYRDFHPRHFETTVTMKYCPLEVQEACDNILATKRRDYTFLKVTNTDFKRLS